MNTPTTTDRKAERQKLIAAGLLAIVFIGVLAFNSWDSHSDSNSENHTDQISQSLELSPRTAAISSPSTISDGYDLPISQRLPQVNLQQLLGQNPFSKSTASAKSAPTNLVEDGVLITANAEGRMNEGLELRLSQLMSDGRSVAIVAGGTNNLLLLGEKTFFEDDAIDDLFRIVQIMPNGIKVEPLKSYVEQIH
jgi:hypothetical protein